MSSVRSRQGPPSFVVRSDRPGAASGRGSRRPRFSHGLSARARLDRIGNVGQRLQFARDRVLAHPQRRGDVPNRVHGVDLEKGTYRLCLNGAQDPLQRGRVGGGACDGTSDLLSVGTHREPRAERTGRFAVPVRNGCFAAGIIDTRARPRTGGLCLNARAAGGGWGASVRCRHPRPIERGVGRGHNDTWSSGGPRSCGAVQPSAPSRRLSCCHSRSPCPPHGGHAAARERSVASSRQRGTPRGDAGAAAVTWATWACPVRDRPRHRPKENVS